MLKDRMPKNQTEVANEDDYKKRPSPINNTKVKRWGDMVICQNDKEK